MQPVPLAPTLYFGEGSLLIVRVSKSVELSRAAKRTCLELPSPHCRDSKRFSVNEPDPLKRSDRGSVKLGKLVINKLPGSAHLTPSRVMKESF